MTTSPDARSIGIRELAELTGYSTSTIYYRVEQGYIQSERAPDGTHRIPVSEVARLARRPKYARVEA